MCGCNGLSGSGLIRIHQARLALETQTAAETKPGEHRELAMPTADAA